MQPNSRRADRKEKPKRHKRQSPILCGPKHILGAGGKYFLGDSLFFMVATTVLLSFYCCAMLQSRKRALLMFCYVACV